MIKAFGALGSTHPFCNSGLWRGTAVTLVRDWPSFGVYFAVYEGMQEVLQPGSRASGEISTLALLTAGEIAANPENADHKAAGCMA